jgi:hypothetical protein
MTIRLAGALRAWGTPGFNDALKQEIEQMDHDRLPLQQGLSVGNHVLDQPVSAMVIAAAESDGAIRAKVGIFYTSILTGCACTNDPTPESENSEYCVVQLDIDRATAETQVKLVEG